MDAAKGLAKGPGGGNEMDFIDVDSEEDDEDDDYGEESDEEDDDYGDDDA